MNKQVRMEVTTAIPPLPFKPLHKILSQYVKAHNMPLRMSRWEEVVRAFYHYNHIAKILN